MRASTLLAAWLALVPALAGAAELGTLFTTPEERERLDRLRRGEPGASGSGPATGRVTGFVQRSDGRNTLWVDGVPVNVNSSKAAPLMDPTAVRDYADRKDERLHVERRPAH